MLSKCCFFSQALPGTQQIPGQQPPPLTQSGISTKGLPPDKVPSNIPMSEPSQEQVVPMNDDDEEITQETIPDEMIDDIGKLYYILKNYSIEHS